MILSLPANMRIVVAMIHRRKLISTMSKLITYTNPEITTPHPGATVSLPHGFGPVDLKSPRIFFFDIDNCLYKRSTKIHDMMQVKIHDYFTKTLNLSDDDAHALHMNYYKTYGLALEGLVRNHKVDALEYNSVVDDALDLNSVLSYDEKLRNMLINIKKSGKYDTFWLLTNAYKNHALRVILFLGIGDLFDGLTYCDYSQSPIVCKPMLPFFENVVNITGSQDAKKISFVDDSEINVKAAFKLGWGKVYHYVEIDEEFKKIKAKDDFDEYYGDDKIIILRDILELEKHA